jgi:hypothetical protein
MNVAQDVAWTMYRWSPREMLCKDISNVTGICVNYLTVAFRRWANQSTFSVTPGTYQLATALPLTEKKYAR